MMLTEIKFDSVVKYLYAEDCGMGQFYIAHAVDDVDSMLFIYLDKYGIFNVFRSMEQYTLYVEGSECERICVEDDEEKYELQEGVDVLDFWLYNNIRNINQLFEAENERTN